MEALYIFVVALTFVCNIGALYYAIQLARARLTSSFTWSLISFALLTRIMLQVFGLRYFGLIVLFISGFTPKVILATQALQMLGLLAFFVAFGRLYYAVKRETKQ